MSIVWDVDSSLQILHCHSMSFFMILSAHEWGVPEHFSCLWTDLSHTEHINGDELDLIVCLQEPQVLILWRVFSPLQVPNGWKDKNKFSFAIYSRHYNNRLKRKLAQRRHGTVVINLDSCTGDQGSIPTCGGSLGKWANLRPGQPMPCEGNWVVSPRLLTGY